MKVRLPLTNHQQKRKHAPRTRLGVRDFTSFAGVQRPEEMRQVTHTHRMIAWLDELRASRLGLQVHP